MKTSTETGQRAGQLTATINQLKEIIKIQERRITNLELNMRRLELRLGKDKANARAARQNLDRSIQMLKQRSI